jgi:hypothetical protein
MYTGQITTATYYVTLRLILHKQPHAHTILSNHSKPEDMKNYVLLRCCVQIYRDFTKQTKLPFLLLCHMALGGETFVEAMLGVFYAVL